MKRLLTTTLIGQQGINLIEGRLLAMGQVWRPTAIHDTGIDGSLELRNDQNSEVTNLILQIQSKATAGAFESESSEGFTFTVSEDDLAYWLSGNIPVLLVVSRPSTDEAYWKSIKDYFHGAKSKQRRVRFDKKADAFDKSAVSKLWSLATSNQATGTYQAPAPVSESLDSNLLAIKALPRRLFLASSTIADRKQFADALGATKQWRSEWVLKNRQVLSVHDLREEPFRGLCDQGTVEDFPTEQWSLTADVDAKNDFVSLLVNCLRGRLDVEGVSYQGKRPFRLFYFRATKDRKPKIFSYRSAQNETSRQVFRAYFKRKTNALLYYRHSALRVRFHRLEGVWYAELSPTYYFTYFEDRPSRFYEDDLSGIKRLERNNAVHGQLLMWKALLTRRSDLLGEEYPHLQFEDLLSVTCPVGVDDASWLASDEFDNRGEDQSLLLTQDKNAHAGKLPF